MNARDQDRREVYSVSRLNSEVRAVLDSSFPLLWVEGELSGLATPRSGHLYFNLKDAHAQVRCAMFRPKRQLLRFQPADGDQVVARVRVGLYEPRGDFQLVVEHLEPAGAGAAQQAFEALKQKLQAEGLFDAARKRRLPVFPRRIGVITSPSGAALRDVLKVLRRRAPYLAVTVFPAQVQGRGAAAELVSALDLAIRRADCDVLLLTRGGGSPEDLLAFNDETLARTIAASPIPVVSAVGHEIDFTIADFVADRRAPTPSAAAELISPDSDALQRTLVAQSSRLGNALRRRLQHDATQLRSLGKRLRSASPGGRLRQQQQQLDSIDLRLLRSMRNGLARRSARLETVFARLQRHHPAHRVGTLRERYARLPARLEQVMHRRLREHHQRLQSLGRQLHAVSPLATMQRGYAVLRQPETGAVVSSVAQVRTGDALEALLVDGSLALEVVRSRPSD